MTPALDERGAGGVKLPDGADDQAPDREEFQ
jgi:hypothetical protein